MNLLWPGLLALAAFVAIPVAFHLLARRHVQESPFPTLRFLAEARRRAGHGYRFRRLLLLAARATAVAALALAFARPYALRPLPAHESAGRFAFVLDDSLSMRARAAGTPLFDLARAECRRRIAALAPADRAAVLLGATPLTDGAVSGAEALAALDRAAPGHGGFDPEKALAAALRAVAGDTRVKGITLFTDLQRASFPARLSAPPDGISLTLRDAKPDGFRPRNLAVGSLALLPDAPPARAIVRLAATLANPGDADLAVRIEARTLEGRAALAEETVPAFGEARAAVDLSFEREGPSGGTVRFDAADDLPDDDARHFRVEVSPVLYALCLHPGRESGGFFARAALNPTAGADPARGLHIQAVDAEYKAERPTLDPFDLVVADSPPADRALAAALLAYVRSGGNLLLLSETHEDLPAFAAAFAELLPAPPVSFEGRSGSTLPLFSIAGFDAAHPLFRRYDGGDFTLDEFRFFRILNVDPARMAKEARAVAEFAPGLPALLERRFPGGGRVLHLLAGLSARVSTAPHSLQFVPFLQETARALRRASPLLTSGDLACGARALLVSARTDLGETALVDPAGQRIPLSAASAGDTLRLLSPPLTAPGLYRAEARAGETVARALVAVNPPAEESRLEYAPREALLPAGAAPDDAGDDPAAPRHARVEWNALLFTLVFLLLCAESFLVQRADKDAA